MRFYLIALTFIICISCKNKDSKEVVASVDEVQEKAIKIDTALEIYDFEGFQKFLNKTEDKTYVINFWATWCAPCVKELPYFEKLNKQYQDDVEVVLVSLDFPHLYDSKLKPFIKNNNLMSKVIALNDPNENKWINQIDASWSGSIPATIIYNKNERKFFERSFTFEELEKEINQLK